MQSILVHYLRRRTASSLNVAFSPYTKDGALLRRHCFLWAQRKTTAVKANCFEKLFKTFLFLRSRDKILFYITCTCAQKNIWENNILAKVCVPRLPGSLTANKSEIWWLFVCSVVAAPKRKQCPRLAIPCTRHENWQFKTIEALNLLLIGQSSDPELTVKWCCQSAR